MSYLVMECHEGYAVVLGENGRFLKVANLNYTVGETISSVVILGRKPRRYQFKALTAIAACLCFMLVGARYLLLSPYGTVRLEINPDVMITANRFSYVIEVEALNEDGKTLVEEYNYHFKKIDQVTRELSVQASGLGYLSEGGTIRLTILSDHITWEKDTEYALVKTLSDYFGESIKVETNEEQDTKDLSNPAATEQMTTTDNISKSTMEKQTTEKQTTEAVENNSVKKTSSRESDKKNTEDKKPAAGNEKKSTDNADSNSNEGREKDNDTDSSSDSNFDDNSSVDRDLDDDDKDDVDDDLDDDRDSDDDTDDDRDLDDDKDSDDD